MERQINNVNTIEKASAEEMDTIDLLEVFSLFARHIRLLIAITLLGAGLAFGATKELITPQYTASAMVYILSKTTSITSLADLQIGTQLTADFEVLATSRPVVEPVIQQLGLNTTYEKLVKTITISNAADTRILKVSVENPDPKLAADISNAMAESLCNRVAQVMNTDRPSLVEDAVTPQSPSSPNVMRNTAIGGLLGLVVCAAVLLLREMLDDTVKTEEDVTKYLGINTLAAIPLESGRAEGRRSKQKPTGGKQKKPARKRAEAA